jgi:hypothetical protein
MPVVQPMCSNSSGIMLHDVLIGYDVYKQQQQVARGRGGCVQSVVVSHGLLVTQ